MAQSWAVQGASGVLHHVKIILLPIQDLLTEQKDFLSFSACQTSPNNPQMPQCFANMLIKFVFTFIQHNIQNLTELRTLHFRHKTYAGNCWIN